MNQINTAPYGALLLRVTLGGFLIPHGLMKLLVFGLAGTAGFFESVGFPGWLGYVVTFAELLGGVALVIGFHARWVALALVPILLGAASVHWGNGFVFSNKGGGWEFPVFWAAALFAQFLLGDGVFALKKFRST